MPDSEARAVIARTLTASVAAGQLTPVQKRTLAQIVSERTGISQADAEKRIDQAYTDAVAAIDNARKAAVLTGLATATALAGRPAGRVVRGAERWPPSRRKHSGPLPADLRTDGAAPAVTVASIVEGSG